MQLDKFEYNRRGKRHAYNIGDDAVRGIVATFINDDNYSWFTVGMSTRLKATIACFSGFLGGLLLEQILDLSPGIPPGLGILFGTVLETGGIAREYIMKRIEYRISPDTSVDLGFFWTWESMGAQLYDLENMTMPDGSHFNKDNTLLVLNVRVLYLAGHSRGGCPGFTYEQVFS